MLALKDLRVCVLPYIPCLSGKATYALEMARALVRLGADTWLVGFNLPSTIEHERHLHYVEMGRLPDALRLFLGPLPSSWMVSWVLRKKLERFGLLENIDMFHFIDPLFTLSFLDKKYITTPWSSISESQAFRVFPTIYEFPSSLLALMSRLQFSVGEHVVCAKAAGVQCITKDIYREKSRFYNGRAWYVPPPLDIEHNRSKPRQDESKVPLILTVASDLAMKRKNIVSLFKACLQLWRRRVTKFSLLLVGRYNDRIMSEAMSISSKTGIGIYLPGTVSKRQLYEEIYPTADIFVYPTFYDDLPYAVLEAMAFGLALVVSNIGLRKDVVVEGGNGFSVEPSASEISSKLQFLLSNPDLLPKMREESARKLRELQDKAQYSLVKIYSSLCSD